MGVRRQLQAAPGRRAGHHGASSWKASAGPSDTLRPDDRHTVQRVGKKMHEGTAAGGQFHPLEENDPRTVASYRIAARLGAGGMGQVYLSYTPGGHPIAVKVIRPEL